MLMQKQQCSPPGPRGAQPRPGAKFACAVVPGGQRSPGLPGVRPRRRSTGPLPRSAARRRDARRPNPQSPLGSRRRSCPNIWLGGGSRSLGRCPRGRRPRRVPRRERSPDSGELRLMHGKVETPESLFPSRTYSKEGRRRGREGRAEERQGAAAERARGGAGRRKVVRALLLRRRWRWRWQRRRWRRRRAVRNVPVLFASLGSAGHDARLSAPQPRASCLHESRLIGQRAPPFKTTSSPGHWLRAS